MGIVQLSNLLKQDAFDLPLDPMPGSHSWDHEADLALAGSVVDQLVTVVVPEKNRIVLYWSAAPENLENIET